jgi:hypothetical protein
MQVFRNWPAVDKGRAAALRPVPPARPAGGLPGQIVFDSRMLQEL